MRKLTALLLALTMVLCLASCGTVSPGVPEQAEEPVHKIGVIVYNTADEEVIGFREYLQGYIESNFEMVQFIYSDSIRSGEEELDFIQSACDSGAEGFLSFLSHDLAAEVALCGKNKVYYLLASGTVSAEAFDSVADDPWFLGMFGPDQPIEFQAGADMARFFIGEETGTRYFILSGGAAMRNEMHYQRTLGILDTFASAYGVTFTPSCEELARSTGPVTVETDKLTVTICPGYVSREEYLEIARQAYNAGSYDAVLSVLPPEEMVIVIEKTPLGVVDSYNTRNFQMFADGSLRFVVGKYSSLIGPAFALMLNAVTGHAEEYRDGGRAIKVTQGFWFSDSAEDYNEKYALSVSPSMNAYNFEDLSGIIRIYNSDSSLDDLVTLAEACDYRAVLARRNGD